MNPRNRIRVGAAIGLALCGLLPATAAPMPPDAFLRVGFDRLASFKYAGPQNYPAGTVPPTNPDHIPAGIRALDGKKVIVRGFMVPVKLEGGLAVEFLLTKDPQACCFGLSPYVNDWIFVRMAKGVSATMEVPLLFAGTLRVRELWDSGWLTGIYLLEGQAGPLPDDESAR
ncbi:MAG: DUF3299 domain-containing protein [Opitutus sp.]|nr:DUF3299 domain-containing protein [Opitutus sp.]